MHNAAARGKRVRYNTWIVGLYSPLDPGLCPKESLSFLVAYHARDIFLPFFGFPLLFVFFFFFGVFVSCTCAYFMRYFLLSFVFFLSNCLRLSNAAGSLACVCCACRITAIALSSLLSAFQYITMHSLHSL